MSEYFNRITVPGLTDVCLNILNVINRETFLNAAIKVMQMYM